MRFEDNVSPMSGRDEQAEGFYSVVVITVDSDSTDTSSTLVRILVYRRCRANERAKAVEKTSAGESWSSFFVSWSSSVMDLFYSKSEPVQQDSIV